jgi:hypothetical protein
MWMNAKNSEDLAIETDSPTNLDARTHFARARKHTGLLREFLKDEKVFGDLTYNQNSFLLMVIEESIKGEKDTFGMLLSSQTYDILLSSITASSYMRILEYNDLMLNEQTHLRLYL